MKIRRRADGMLYDAERKPAITGPERVSGLEPTFEAAPTRNTLFLAFHGGRHCAARGRRRDWHVSSGQLDPSGRGRGLDIGLRF